MKTTKKREQHSTSDADELRDHYDFDFAKAKPNRFAERLSKEAIVIVLDPDVATVFRTSESVNEALRVLITASGTVAETRQANIKSAISPAAPSRP